MAGVPVRVLVADDQQAGAVWTAAGLGSNDALDVVGVAMSADEAARIAAMERPDVALVAVRLAGGAERAVRRILLGSPRTRVLAYSGASEHDAVIAMLRAGAGGYIRRGGGQERVVAAVRRAAAGESIFDDAAGADRAARRARISGVMENDELDIVFQPIVKLDSRQVVGYEALSRFAGQPERPPNVWFEEAHQVGLGEELELWAVRVASERSAALPKGAFMAVNVSPVTTERPELLALLASAYVDHVMLEVTEHAPVEDYPRFRVAIARVRELGACLAVDDAGAGFASLRHILELDAEFIKLDGSLTHSLEIDPRRRSLASALIEFGRESGASVLAEHIESELQLCELRRLGVLYGQGFHLGRPQRLPAAAA
jgi:EAL domain-containing protein (putative c-di-GMP-specific phosphodiesterase class I)